MKDNVKLLLWSILGSLIISASCASWLFSKLAIFSIDIATLFLITLGTSFFLGLILASEGLEYNKILLGLLIMIFAALLILVIVYEAPMLAGKGEVLPGYTLLLIQHIAFAIIIIVPSGLIGSIIGAAFGER